MTEQERKDWDALEEAAEKAGGYVIHIPVTFTMI